ncbi:zeta toxin family protein [Rheinheimera baltica]|uniref:zeta toxin family protein n=1 Tax=Rheinheimera baltica TaxID=67576 RepID=UPI00040D9B03|nr:zeta toxin family protein [Rheinheimera baltica]
MTEQEIIDSAFFEAKKMRTKVAREITDKKKYRPSESPSSIFMSGSPGAGKTEVSKELAAISEDGSMPILRIDPDEYRSYFSLYDGCNSHLFQRAIVPIVERVLDLALDNCQDFILDGTLSNFDVAKRNIDRSLRRGRFVYVIFVLQDPLVSWEFVKAREKVEGRRILPETFVEQFFKSQETVNQLKAELGAALWIDVVVKDYNQSIGDWRLNVDSVDDAIFQAYNARALLDAIK